nr:MAG TPA: hypothetical protein [Caudoviricetes sp.]
MAPPLLLGPIVAPTHEYVNPFFEKSKKIFRGGGGLTDTLRAHVI